MRRTATIDRRRAAANDGHPLGRLVAAALAAATAALLLVQPPATSARKPVISYVDGAGRFQLYDLERGRDLKQPPVPVANAAQFRWGMSLDGRFVVYTDAGRKLHLLDRFAGRELPLPGIDVYANPGNLTVSNLGLIGFDDNGNGPTAVYDYKQRKLIPTGFAAQNKQRQPKLSGDGRYLATTCLDAAQCVVDLGADSNPFVQDLMTRRDTGFGGEVDMRDEEHPCVNGDGSLVALDRQSPNANSPRDIFLYRRASGRLVPTPGLNSDEAETFCILDSAGRYLGFLFDNQEMRIYDRERARVMRLPDRGFDTRSTFSDILGASRLRVSPRRVRSGRAGRFLFELTTKADVHIAVERRVRRGWKRVGSLRRRHRIGGRNRIRFRARSRGRRWVRGRYRARLTATGGRRGEPAARKRAHFRVGG